MKKYAASLFLLAFALGVFVCPWSGPVTGHTASGEPSSRALIFPGGKPLPLVSEESLNQGVSLFRMTCHLCGSDFNGRVMRPDLRQKGCLHLVCPRCGLPFDVFAPDERGVVHRPTWFMRGFSPAVRLNRPLDVWLWVLGHCRYAGDEEFFGRMEVWQLAKDTYHRRRGDCEDTAILLGDWLGASGFDARVAIGKVRRGGHAWVALRQDGRTYILETTGGRGAFRRTPPRAELMADYFPRVQFDRRGVWFRTARNWASDYWSEADWAKGPSE